MSEGEVIQREDCFLKPQIRLFERGSSDGGGAKDSIKALQNALTRSITLNTHRCREREGVSSVDSSYGEAPFLDSPGTNERQYQRSKSIASHDSLVLSSFRSLPPHTPVPPVAESTAEAVAALRHFISWAYTDGEEAALYNEPQPIRNWVKEARGQIPEAISQKLAKLMIQDPRVAAWFREASPRRIEKFLDLAASRRARKHSCPGTKSPYGSHGVESHERILPNTMILDQGPRFYTGPIVIFLTSDGFLNRTL
eukprot:Protomagalhaensia_wolfi_Nauph_80__575@NODE_1325_length_1587_cov_145_767442_g1024_i0_p1_GENE_NODE_1325_length_1587_cov_145_767442_g1024_i0NODE_1325_length_1587_cov_145_767442_g1024_i0_p1_ORF_typecomplete_len254_score17_42_NODE_1325_length_1587_cov_145_767442_g1024_i06621423